MLLGSAYAASVYGPHLLKAVTRATPRARLRMRPLPRESKESATVAGRQVDGFLMPRGMGAHGFVGVDLFRDRWSCLVAVGNAAGELTIETMAAAPWVVQDTTEDANPVLAALRAQGVEPRIECVVGDFHSIVFLVRDSDRIGLVPSRLAGSW